MTQRGVQRLLSVVLALALASVVPTVAADLTAAGAPQPPAWSAAVVAVHAALLLALTVQAARPGTSQRLFWALVVSGDLALATYPFAAGGPSTDAPWVLALSPVTVGAGAVVAGTGGALLLGLLHVALRLLLQASGVWAVTPLAVVLDAALLLVIVLAASVAVQATRSSARQVQGAQEAADEAAARVAVVRAGELEDARWDAIVHDDVLAALSTTAQARGGADREDARAAARTALARVEVNVHRDGERAPLDLAAVLERVVAAVRQLHPAADVAGAGARGSGEAAVSVEPDVADALVEATAEAVRNSLRHGRPAGSAPPAVRVRLRTDRRRGRLSVEVRDDGVGFDDGGPDGGGPPSRRLGLAVSVARRADVVGGSARVRSAPGVGTVVLLSVPCRVLPPDAPAAAAR